MTANLKLVGKEDAPTDITLAMRAEIMSRDWGGVHVRGDRAPAISLPTRRRWSWSSPSPPSSQS